MKLLCRLLDHRRALPVIHNHGLSFSTCRRCGAELVRERGARWRAVPAGLRVVWKAHGRHAPLSERVHAEGGEPEPIRKRLLDLPKAPPPLSSMVGTEAD